MYCNPSQFSLQLFSFIYVVLSFPACGRLSLSLHHSVGSVIYFSSKSFFRLGFFKGWADLEIYQN